MFFSNENTTNQTYLCASYSRLSQEDGDKEESNSIVNQKALIRDFIVERPEGLFLIAIVPNILPSMS